MLGVAGRCVPSWHSAYTLASLHTLTKWKDVCVYVRMCVCMCVCMHVCMRVCIMCVCVYVCVYACMCVCMYVDVGCGCPHQWSWSILNWRAICTTSIDLHRTSLIFIDLMESSIVARPVLRWVSLIARWVGTYPHDECRPMPFLATDWSGLVV